MIIPAPFSIVLAPFSIEHGAVFDQFGAFFDRWFLELQFRNHFSDYSKDEHDLIDSQKSLAEDEKFYKDMKSECGTKTQEWTQRSQMRLTETTGINEAINILMEEIL